MNESELIWTSDAENVRTISCRVSETLARILDEQRKKLDTVDAKEPGKVRRQLARQAGVFCALAKGAHNRELKPDRIFIPGSEFTQAKGKLRISVLKANLPIPENVRVKNVTFIKDGEIWTAVLEVVDAPAVKAAA